MSMEVGGVTTESPVSTVTTEADSQICRDFLRNVCHRGRRCKFPHPAGVVVATKATASQSRNQTGGGGGADPLSFCHDFQNGQCARPSCRFLHCSVAEEREYRQSGVISAEALYDAIARGAELKLAPAEAPVCKDYARGDCARAAKCKYRHMSVEEIRAVLAGHAANSAGCNGTGGSVGSSDEPDSKRRHMGTVTEVSHRVFSGGAYSTSTSAIAAGATVPLVEYQIMENDNRILCRQLQELKKQVDVLKTTNEFLLDQNAQLRFSKPQPEPSPAGSAGATRVTTVSVPAVSLSTSMPAAAAAAPLAMAPISQPLAPGQTAQVVTVPGSMAAVPVSLARTPGTAAVAVSLASVSMQQPVAVASMSSIQTAEHPSSIQVAPLSTIQAAQSSLPSIQVATMSSIQPTQPPLQMNGPVACSISGAPVVSYPIVSQQLRPLHPSDLPAQ